MLKSQEENDLNNTCNEINVERQFHINGRRPLHPSAVTESGKQSSKCSAFYVKVPERKKLTSKTSWHLVRPRRFLNVSPNKTKNSATESEYSLKNMQNKSTLKPITPEKLKLAIKYASETHCSNMMSPVSLSSGENSKEDMDCENLSAEKQILNGKNESIDKFSGQQYSDIKITSVYSVNARDGPSSLSQSTVSDTEEKTSSGSSGKYFETGCNKIGSKTSEKKSCFIDAFGFLRKDFESNLEDNSPGTNEDEDDLIVVSKIDEDIRFTYWDIKRVVKNMVKNTMINESGSIDEITPAKVAQRMQQLYHQDFTDRLPDISECLDRAKLKCRRASYLLKEIRPGLRHQDIVTLNPEEWLNDVVINEYFSLLARSKPTASCVSSFFYEELQRNVHPALPDKWYWKNYLLIPICIDSHWSLLCALPTEQKVEIYNSMMVCEKEEECAQLVAQYLEYCYNTTLKTESSWAAYKISSLPHQENEYDCGVYTCMFARKILFGLSSLIKPESVTQFRAWLKDELIKNCLLY